MKIVMVGSGNTATVLCAVLSKAQHEIVQIVSRNVENAKILAAAYDASYTVLTDPHFADADFYIIALHDAALDHYEKYAALKNKLVVHTAGAISKDVLKTITNTYGVMYPVQTLSKFTEHIPEIPFLIDANTKECLHQIMGLAKSISANVEIADDKVRLSYHVAAVFVSNFSNHIYALAEIFCQKEKLQFKSLLPLINEVTQRVNHYSPYLTQTGPAMRDDIFTLNRHLQALATYPDLKYIYLKMSESIIKIHGKR